MAMGICESVIQISLESLSQVVSETITLSEAHIKCHGDIARTVRKILAADAWVRAWNQSRWGFCIVHSKE